MAGRKGFRQPGEERGSRREVPLGLGLGAGACDPALPKTACVGYLCGVGVSA